MLPNEMVENYYCLWITGPIAITAEMLVNKYGCKLAETKSRHNVTGFTLHRLQNIPKEFVGIVTKHEFYGN